MAPVLCASLAALSLALACGAASGHYVAPASNDPDGLFDDSRPARAPSQDDCALFPVCKAAGLLGSCCPASGGMMLGCCGDVYTARAGVPLAVPQAKVKTHEPVALSPTISNSKVVQQGLHATTAPFPPVHSPPVSAGIDSNHDAKIVAGQISGQSTQGIQPNPQTLQPSPQVAIQATGHSGWTLQPDIRMIADTSAPLFGRPVIRGTNWGAPPHLWGAQTPQIQHLLAQSLPTNPQVWGAQAPIAPLIVQQPPYQHVGSFPTQAYHPNVLQWKI